MNFNPLLKYLESEQVVQLGYTPSNPMPAAFKHRVPSQVKANKTVLFMDGYGGTEINHYAKGYFRAQFIVVVACADYEEGRALMKEISDSLTLYEVDLPGMRVQQCLPANLPVSYPVDDSDLVEHAVTFDIAYVSQEE